MPNFVLSPNMSLPVPVVGQELGPQYAYDVNNCMSLIDNHNHAFGNGVQITPNGLNINADLNIQVNNLTSIKTVRFSPQLTVITGTSPNLGCLYEVVNDLYYNDGVGNQVRITQSGGVAGSPGSISGLVSPASASYSPGSSTFTWQSGANIPANMDFGSATFRDITAGSNGVTLNPPAALAADYSLTFPAALPGATSFTTIDSSGNIANTIPVSQGITSANIATNGIARSNLPLVGQQISASCGVQFFGFSGTYQPITNLSITITTTGRPVMILLQPDGVTFASTQIDPLISSQNWAFGLFRGATMLQEWQYSATSQAQPYRVQTAITALDVVAAGTYTYSLQVNVLLNNPNGIGISHYVLVAYEL